MISTNVSKKFLVILILVQVGCFAASTKNVEEQITKKFKAATPGQLNKYKADAAKRLQANLVRALQALSTGTTVPANVRTSAKDAVKSIRSGKLATPLANALPAIMKQASNQQGKPAQQLKAILGTVIPKAPNDTKNPLQNVMTYVSGNLTGVNALLGKLLGGPGDLLSDVVKNLTGSLGAVTDSTTASLGQLGTLLGGLMTSG